MKQTVLRCYSAWRPEENAADLDRRSRAGWGLVRAGFVRYVFEPDERIWRYGLDYCPVVLGHGEWERRRDRCAAAGWEVVNATATGWTYFRRAWDPALPEEAYRLPSDYTPEQRKLVGPISLFFWLRILLIAVGLALAVLAVVRQKSMVLPAVIYLLCMLFLFFRMQALQEKLK